MDARRRTVRSTDEYIAQFPGEIQEKLQQLRQIIRESAPEAEETISYGMPAFRLRGILVYFAAFRDHISFFPTSSAMAAFSTDLAGYSTSRGTVRFPLDKPIPLDLVRSMVEFRVGENLRKRPGKRDSGR